MTRPPATGPLRCDPASTGHPDDAAGADGLQVRFCGGCNPFIDRVGVADAIRAGLASSAGANTDGSAIQPAPTVYISGCQRACASQHRLTAEDEAAAVVVAGENVDATPTAAAGIPATVLSTIRPPAAPPPSGPPPRHMHRDIADEG